MSDRTAPLPAGSAAAPEADALPSVRFDWIPLLLVAGLALAALPAIGSPSTWLTLTVAGLAMGMIVFITAIRSAALFET